MALESGLFKNATAPTGVQPITKVQAAGATTAPPAWDYTMDPTYQAAMNAGSSQFNFARNRDLAALSQQEMQNTNQQRDLATNSTEARRRLAGSYAARGMAGGQKGALYSAQDRLNAEQVADQTDLKQQISALNSTFLQNYGATGTDWTGTLVGQQYKTSAIQEALNARLKGMGI
jgi:hypothetical protein